MTLAIKSGLAESFPGLGVQPPTALLVMGLTLMCCNLVGDGLRDAIDPKDR